MRLTAICLSAALLAAPLALAAQTTNSSPSQTDLQVPAPANRALPTHIYPKKVVKPLKPFSALAFSGGISAEGVNLQAATNVNRYLNLRAIGNVFNYTVSNVDVSGFTVNGKLNLATMATSLDYYPFPNHGLRLSPGVQFYNQNSVTANVQVAGGTKLTLNDVNYYASTANPITGTGSVGLNTQNPAFTGTIGWGNMIPRKGEHWSFPFEIGVAVVGSPNVNVALTSGLACNAQGQNCVNVATDPTVNANLQAQIAKYKSDLDPLKVYPIFSFGVSYSFKIR